VSHIVVHNASPILGGGEISMALLLRGLQARGHRVEMLCRDPHIAERVAAYGVPTGVEHIGGDAMLPHALRFAARLRRDRPDALLLSTFKKVLLAGLAARMSGVPRVVLRIVLETDTPRRGPHYRFALRHFVDAIALNAESMRAGFLAGDPALDPGKVRVLVDGVAKPERRESPGAVRRALGLAPATRVIGAIGRLAHQKRYDRFVRALAALPSDVHGVLAGDGETRADLETLADRLGVRPRLHLLGFRTDLGDVLDALDVFVLCSDREGMANSMLEAMAAGVPVISTPVSGAKEALIDDGPPAGVLIGFEDAELVAALETLLVDGRRRSALAEAGRERARARYSFDAMVERWETLLAAPGSL
jgi:glycosyltransferase involved in cell wall biosynthesis